MPRKSLGQWKAKGKEHLLTSGEQGGSADSMKPQVSISSRIFYRNSSPEDAEPDTKKHRKGRNTGKLSQLLEMPLDVVFEIAGKLRPIDLLHLSRVSKQFRQTFASKDSRALWVAARRNVSDLPDPPAHISEPRYASLLFEYNCFACGVGRSPKLDHAFCVRFCGACWKANVKKGTSLLRQYKYADQAVLQLIPREYHSYTSPSAEMNNTWSMYYAPEFEAVSKKYMSLSAADKPAYVEERKKLVTELHEHAKAVVEWEGRVRQTQADEDDRAQKSRQSSIEARLFEMGYTTADFPPRWHPDWSPLVNQPRELTARIWKTIEPKLIRAIEKNRERLIEQARTERHTQRRNELEGFYDAWLATQPMSLGLVPKCPDLSRAPGVDVLLSRDDYHTVVTQADFDNAALPEIQRLVAENNAKLVKALREEWEKQGKHQPMENVESFGDQERLKSFMEALEMMEALGGGYDSDEEDDEYMDEYGVIMNTPPPPFGYRRLGLGVPGSSKVATGDNTGGDGDNVASGSKIEENVADDNSSGKGKGKAKDTGDSADASASTSTEPEPDTEEKQRTDLLRATALFRCGHCPTFPNLGPLSFLELCAHHRENHLRSSYLYSSTVGLHYTVDAQAVGITRLVLDTLKLEANMKYEELGTGKRFQIVCTCGKPGMEQPMTFSKLIGHLCQEANWMARMQRDRVIGTTTAREVRPGDRLIDDHAPAEFPKLLKLLKDGEEYVAPPQPATTIVFNGGTTRACKICTRFMAVMLRSEYFNSAESFAHHVRQKHGREPTQEDLRDF